MQKVLILFSLIFFACSGIQAQAPQTAQEFTASAVTNFRGGNLDAALGDANNAIKLNPNYVDAYYMRAIIYEKKGDIEKAFSDYSKVIELEPNGKGVEIVYTNRATIYLKKGEYDKAIEDYNKAAKIAPGTWQIYNQRAVAKLMKRDMEGSLADYEKAIELQPNIPSLVGRGYFRYQKNDFEGALADFTRAIKINDTYGSAYIKRGIVYGLKGDLEQSIADFKKSVSLQPDLILEVINVNFTSPFQELNQYIAKNPDNARAYQIRAIFRLLQKKQTEAEQDFSKALKLDANLKSEIEKIKKEFSQQ